MLFRLVEIVRGHLMLFPFWMSDRGAKGEYLARRHFHRRGYHLVAKNWHLGKWELDAVMSNGKRLFFLEVKTRARKSRAGVEDAITADQKRRLRQMVPVFLEQWPEVEIPWRLLLVRVVLRGLRYHIEVGDLE